MMTATFQSNQAKRGQISSVKQVTIVLMSQELTFSFIDLSHYLICHFDLSIYNYYLSSSLHPKPPMKIIQQIQTFASKAVRRLLDFIVPSRHKDRPKDDSHQHCRKTQKKRSKRRLNFNSYLAKNNSKSLSRSLRKQRKIHKYPLISKIIYHDLSENNQNLKPSEEAFLKHETIYNQPVEVATGIQIHDEILFTDKYGLQISAIESKDNKTRNLNYSSESDPEILKFMLGDSLQIVESEIQQQLDNEKKWRERNQIGDQYWWALPLQQQRNKIKNPQKDNSSSVMSIKSQNVSNFGLHRRQKSKKIKHSQKGKTPSQQKPRIIKTIFMNDEEQQITKPYRGRLTKCIVF